MVTTAGDSPARSPEVAVGFPSRVCRLVVTVFFPAVDVPREWFGVPCDGSIRPSANARIPLPDGGVRIGLNEILVVWRDLHPMNWD